MKYKVGDMVKVRKDLKAGKSYGGLCVTKSMEEYRGKIVDISKAFKVDGKDRYYVKGDGWYWTEEMFEPVVTNWDKLEETLTIERFTKLGACAIINRFRGKAGCGGRTCDECREWLEQPYEEPKKEVLDEAEREYLSAVIKPFRNNVLHIEKQLGGIGEYIAISLGYDGVCLPYYKRGTMYKGMEIGKEYTLEELRL